MLARANRITKPSDFRAVITSGSRANSETMAVYCHALGLQAGQPTRVGLVVGKACGSAVLRNRVKRQLRALVRSLLPNLPSDLLLVVRALPLAAEAEFDALRAELSANVELAIKKEARKSRPLEQKRAGA